MEWTPLGKKTNDLFESKTFKILAFMSVVVTIIAGIVAIIDIILSCSLDPSLKYCLSLLFLFSLGFLFLYIQNRLLEDSIKQIKADHKKLLNQLNVVEDPIQKMEN